MTKKEMTEDLLRRLHPEADLDDEETLFGLIYDDYDAYAETILTHEAAIEAARAEGEVQGRNARIEEMLITPAETDGIPNLGGANTAATRPGHHSIFDIARGL